MLTDSNTKPLINDESLVLDTDFDPTKKFYYCYDKNGNYTGAVYSNNQPEESTEIQPVKPYVNDDGNVVEGITVGMTNPKWDGEKWVEQMDPLKPSVAQQLLMQQNQSNVKLQATNAQQTTQIKQLQQMFMLTNQQQAVEKSKEVTA